MNNDGNKILDAIKKMAADDNKGLRMSTTIVDVKDDPRGSIVGFGTEKIVGMMQKHRQLDYQVSIWHVLFYRSRRTEKIPINKREKTLCMKGYYMKAGQIPNINDNNTIYVSRDIRRSSSCLSPESGTFYALLPCRQ